MSDIPATYVPDTSYTEKDIMGDTGLGIVRRRPTALLGDVEETGQNHAIYEVIANSLDEISQMPAGQGRIIITLCLDKERNAYQMIISDNGRGIPLGALHPATTQPHWSGKFNQNAYKTSAGLYGLGMKAASGTADHFRIISCRQGEGTGSLYVNRGKHSDTITTDLTIQHLRGVTCIWEPDPTIFRNIDTYAEMGYELTISLLKKYVFFHPHHIEFRISEKPIDKKVWKCDHQKLLDIVDKTHKQAAVVWNQTLHDADEWVRAYWNVQRPWAFRRRFEKAVKENSGLLDYTVCLYYAKFGENGGRFGMVNNVPIDDPKSDHFKVLYDELSKQIAEFITDKAVKDFFLASYRLPIHMAVDVKFEGAEFKGTTKEGFYSPIFRELYRTDVKGYLRGPDGTMTVNAIYDLLEQDILARYKQSQSINNNFKGNFRLFEQLNFPENLINATGKDRSRCELFLVEGKSAGNSRKGQNPETVGQYQLGGKPYNGLKSGKSFAEIRKDLLTSKDFKRVGIYQDIFTILGYNPSNPQTTGLNYSACHLLVDADKVICPA